MPGGCKDGKPAQPAAPPVPFTGTPTLADIAARDGLVAAQEALLNVYRCRFDIDTQIVPGGCKDGKPAQPAEPAPTAGAFQGTAAGRDDVIFTTDAGEITRGMCWLFPVHIFAYEQEEGTGITYTDDRITTGWYRRCEAERAYDAGFEALAYIEAARVPLEGALAYARWSEFDGDYSAWADVEAEISRLYWRTRPG